MQHLRYPVIGKHGHGIYVVEATVALPLETGPKVGDEDLRAFLEMDAFGFEGSGVVEAGEMGGEQVDEGGSGVIGLADKVKDAAIEI